MKSTRQKDNSTGEQKTRLRRSILATFKDRAPVVLETHGGFGRVYEKTWYRADRGVVIEKDAIKCEHLAMQRPTWAVYQGDCIEAIGAGLAQRTAFDIIDVDPYGAPFDIFDALCRPTRRFPDLWHLVVNDGMRQGAQRGVSWQVDALKPIVARRGNNIFRVYKEVAREIVEMYLARIGFKVTGWYAYYTGHADLMTHYWARCERIALAKKDPGATPSQAKGQDPGPSASDAASGAEQPASG